MSSRRTVTVIGAIALSTKEETPVYQNHPGEVRYSNDRMRKQALPCGLARVDVQHGQLPGLHRQAGRRWPIMQERS